MTLERIRKKSLDEQEKIRETNESCGRWPNGEKAFTCRVGDDDDEDHDRECDLDKKKAIPLENDEEEGRWINMLRLEIERQIELQGGIERKREFQGDVDQEVIERAFAIPRDFERKTY